MCDMGCVQALTEKFNQLEREQMEVQSSLEEALSNERAKRHSLEEEMGRERERRVCLEEEVQRERGKVQCLEEEVEMGRKRVTCLEEEVGRERERVVCLEEEVGRERRGREEAEAERDKLQQELSSCQDQVCAGLEVFVMMSYCIM